MEPTGEGSGTGGRGLPGSPGSEDGDGDVLGHKGVGWALLVFRDPLGSLTPTSNPKDVTRPAPLCLRGLTPSPPRPSGCRSRPFLRYLWSDGPTRKGEDPQTNGSHPLHLSINFSSIIAGTPADAPTTPITGYLVTGH